MSHVSNLNTYLPPPSPDCNIITSDSGQIPDNWVYDKRTIELVNPSIVFLRSSRQQGTLIAALQQLTFSTGQFLGPVPQWRPSSFMAAHWQGKQPWAVLNTVASSVCAHLPGLPRATTEGQGHLFCSLCQLIWIPTGA